MNGSFAFYTLLVRVLYAIGNLDASLILVLPQWTKALTDICYSLALTSSNRISHEAPPHIVSWMGAKLLSCEGGNHCTHKQSRFVLRTSSITHHFDLFKINQRTTTI